MRKVFAVLFSTLPYLSVAGVLLLDTYFGVSFKEFYEPLWFASFVASALWYASVRELVRTGHDNWLHHAYYGQAMILLGSIMHNPAMALLGFVVLLDDAVQHVIQWYGGDFEYRSPLHMLFEKAYSLIH